MLLMIEKGIRRGICHAIPRYAKANNKYMKVYDKNKESSFPIIYTDGQCHKSYMYMILSGLKIFLNLIKAL